MFLLIHFHYVHVLNFRSAAEYFQVPQQLIIQQLNKLLKSVFLWASPSLSTSNHELAVRPASTKGTSSGIQRTISSALTTQHVGATASLWSCSQQPPVASEMRTDIIKTGITFMRVQESSEPAALH